MRFRNNFKNSHESVSETAVIGIPHEIKGESAVAFSILKEKADLNAENVRSELIQLVRGRLAKFAAPEKIYFVSGLPKTRSGKIMRRILRKISAGQIDEIGDVTTLADPSVVELIIQKGRNGFFFTAIDIFKWLEQNPLTAML